MSKIIRIMRHGSLYNTDDDDGWLVDYTVIKRGMGQSPFDEGCGDCDECSCGEKEDKETKQNLNYADVDAEDICPECGGVGERSGMSCVCPDCGHTIWGI